MTLFAVDFSRHQKVNIGLINFVNKVHVKFEALRGRVFLLRFFGSRKCVTFLFVPLSTSLPSILSRSSSSVFSSTAGQQPFPIISSSLSDVDVLQQFPANALISSLPGTVFLNLSYISWIATLLLWLSICSRFVFTPNLFPDALFLSLQLAPRISFSIPFVHLLAYFLNILRHAKFLNRTSAPFSSINFFPLFPCPLPFRSSFPLLCFLVSGPSNCFSCPSYLLFFYVPLSSPSLSSVSFPCPFHALLFSVLLCVALFLSSHFFIS